MLEEAEVGLEQLVMKQKMKMVILSLMMMKSMTMNRMMRKKREHKKRVDHSWMEEMMSCLALEGQMDEDSWDEMFSQLFLLFLQKKTSGEEELETRVA